MSLDEYVRLAKRTLIPEGDVLQQAVKSGVWVSFINVFGRLFELAKVIVLARVLAPTDFGLMGIALLVLAALRQFSQLGIDTALIQREEENIDRYLNTAWTMKAVRGLGLASIAFALAPYAAQFFSEPRAADIIRIIALGPLITGLQNPGVMYLQKNLDFHKQFAYETGAVLANVLVSVILAFLLRNVWALVFGSLAGSVTMFVISYLVHDYRPELEFDRDMATELFDYGKWITASGILLFLLNQGDDAFVGWFIGASALGFYQIAYRFSNAPATEITHTISNVVFPTYSRIQTDERKLRSGYFRTVQITTVISFPMAAGIVAVAPTFVRAFLGEQWLPMVLAMQILAVWGAIRSLSATVGPLFQALDRPDINTKIQAAKLGLVALVIYPATARWGFEGTALAVVGASLVIDPVADYLAVRTVGGSLRRFVRLLLYPGIGSVLMALGVWLVGRNLVLESILLEFLVLVLTGVVVYSAVIVAADSRFDYGLKATLRTMIRAMK